MSARRPFLDTNVLLYLLSDDAAKAARAEGLLRGGAIVSVQVLSEFVAVARRETRLTMAQIRDALAIIRAFCVVRALDIETHERALTICERFGLSIYDSLIVAAAGLADCRQLLTEDLQDGQTIDGVTIANPFRA
ncbi:MAG: PIN domain-containing protein [Phreatobacter sp.]|uniref:PIN domain-containing protein n=1 Tax=Phreatobacter sp. TaxID=1966341 RepID=UPI001A3FB2FC|nr:PIN domain-containing protein [Phreatobacter sp.]MBL8568333.1 PIN domain-containing protein [Phreatobacter sp.]